MDHNEENRMKSDVENGSAPKKTAVSAEETEIVFKRLRKLQHRTAILFFGSIIVLFVGTPVVCKLWNEFGWICFILGIVGIFFAVRALKQYTAEYKEKVVKVVTFNDCGFLEDVTFDVDRGILATTIAATNMIRMGSAYSSNDLITGKYKGVPFRQSDVSIETGGENSSALFRGRWIMFRFNKNFRCDLQVVSKGFITATKRYPMVKLENEDFHKVFNVCAENAEEAFYILTPHFMEAMLRVKKQFKHAPVMFIFIGGTLHVAIMNNRDAFEPSIVGHLDPARERDRTLKELRVITEFVDELSLDRNIYKQDE